MIIIRLLKESLLMAYSSLVTNRLRTFLSLLGITIGIFAIISVFTVINSLESSIRTSIESLGDNVVYVQKWPWSFEPDYPWWKYLNRPVPKLNELKEIKERSKLSDAAAFLATTRQNVQFMDRQVNRATIMCVSHDYEKIWSFDIEKGRYFSHFESINGNNIAILGASVAENLFPGIDPIGREIKVKGNKVKVVGLFKKEGKSIGQTLDEVVLLPVYYARTIFDIRRQSMDPFIMVKARDGITLQALIDELTGIMRGVRKLKPLADDNFALNKASIIIRQFEQVFSGINFAGWIIGGFSILVGAFGIANIMFVTVRERTNIIGIQKAIGAKNYFILAQFLSESIILALIGGMLGLILIYFGTIIANIQIEWEFNLTIGNIVRGLSISVIVGIIAGFIPAWVASRLNPVEAIQTTV